MRKTTKILQAHFFAQDSGKEPVRDWLSSLTKNEKKLIGTDIMSIEFGWPIGMPTVRHIEGSLWEVRTDLDKKIARVFFCTIGNKMILLHGIIKKTQKTLSSDLNIAKRRLKKVRSEK